MRLRSRLLTFGLLLLGLSTAPVGSLEQTAQYGAAAAATPHAAPTRDAAGRAPVATAATSPEAPRAAGAALPAPGLPDPVAFARPDAAPPSRTAWNPSWGPRPGYRAQAPPPSPDLA